MTDGGPPTAPPPRHLVRRTLRWILRGALVAFVAAVLGAMLTGAGLLGVATPIREGRTALEDGRSALLAGDAADAKRSFDEAESRFAEAAHGTTTFLPRLTASFPILGRNDDAVLDLALSGVDLARSGSTLAAALDDLKGGPSALAPSGGAIPIDTMVSLQADLAKAQGLAAGAVDHIGRSPVALLFPPIGSAREQAVRSITDAAHTIGAADELARTLPDFLGAQGQKRYFFAAENPAELRGTGGLIGAYAIVTFHEGRATFSPFRPIQTLPDVPADSVPAPNPDYRDNYDQFGGAGKWQNANMTPDFPSAARATLGAYEQVTGDRLDGVIAADPFALRAMLKITGPATVPGLDVSVGANDVVAFTTNRAYRLFPGPSVRKEVLGDVAAEVFARFLAMQERGIPRIKAIASTAAAGHLLLYSTSGAAQKAFVDAGAAGEFAAPDGDVLSVVVNSGSGSKVDFWANRTVTYGVQLQPGGAAIARTQVAIANGAPTKGQPRYVIGPVPGIAKTGENVSLVSVFCAPGCTGSSPTDDGKAVEVRTGSELGLPFIQDYAKVPAGKSSTFAVTTQVPRVWHGSASGGTYRLTFLGQTTIEPTTVHVTVTAPPGMHVIDTNVPMRVSGATATWEGTPQRNLEIEVTFRASVGRRIWRALTDWLP